MGRKKLEPTPIRAARLKILREREGKSQAEFAVMVGYQDQRQISDMEREKRRVSDDACKAIIHAFPEYRLGWLMGNDGIMTHTDAVNWVKKEVQKQEDALASALAELFIAKDIELRTVTTDDGEQIAHLVKDGISVQLTNEMVDAFTSEISDFFDYLIFKLVR